jgi:nitrogen regulatory protein PII
MPTYRFIDTETDEVFESFMKISEREEFLKENPNIQSIVMSPMIVSSVEGMGSHRVSDGFKEVLSKVAEAHPGSEVANRYGKKSIKEARSAEVVKKHVDRITKRMNNK